MDVINRIGNESTKIAFTNTELMVKSEAVVDPKRTSRLLVSTHSKAAYPVILDITGPSTGQ
ncbi:hypothetical protein LIG30_3049 [Burkholderia sp. lig30]|nr:hypothetical protein LIG30_3049 [Burkholderia sp. lig30]